MKRFLSLLLLFLPLYSVVGVISPVFAANPPKTTLQQRLENVGAGAGLGAQGTGKLDPSAFEKQVGGIINIALTLVGVIFLILTVYGGFTWMTARGDDTQAKKAKDIIVMATIGMAVVLAAYMLTNFIVTRLTNATSITSTP